jgi:hypothetical protein
VREFLDPTPEAQNVVLVDARMVHRVDEMIIGCEACSPDDADLPFDWLLDLLTGNDPAITDYILEAPAKCPRCMQAINEKTLVEVGCYA